MWMSKTKCYHRYCTMLNADAAASSFLFYILILKLNFFYFFTLITEAGITAQKDMTTSEGQCGS